jgi:hypothetical protein
MTAKEITFIEDQVPNLKAGTYEVTVDQHVVIAPSVDEHFSITRGFQVRGARFSILADEIHAVFPPDKSSGPYIGSLPHVVFNRAMLPWLRGLSGVPSAQDDTWLAVLLLDPDEAPEVQTLKVQDLVRSGVTITTPTPGASNGVGALPAGYLSYSFGARTGQSCEIEYGEKVDDLVLAIDVPAALFKAVAPALADMAYLGHVREVGLEGRSARAGRGAVRDIAGLEVGQFATVVGNRMPKLADSNAFLVSLEGMGDFLPGGTEASLSPYSHVRLVVLKAWRFNTIPSNEAVLKLALQHLCDDRVRPGKLISHLRVPAEIPSPDEVAAALSAQASGQMSDDQAKIQMRHAFAMGYVPLSHHMRTGGRDISWYRGPLTPAAVQSRLSVPLDSSDAALAYNPQTGLFDVSYAAAWQLGQLLALRNRQFATAIYGWQLALVEKDAASRDQLSRSVSLLATRARAGGDDLASIFTRLFAAQFTDRRSRGFARAADGGTPPVVENYLADLKQLKGLPLNYLIPDERMMPAESLRFFHLDTNWINALLDGACSIVRSISGESISPAPWLYPADQPAITGYLLNSKVVIAWPGLKLAAFHGNTELTRIFDDDIAPGLRMALFNGDMDRLEAQEAGEGLHFGVDVVDDTTYRVPLRQLTGQPGKPITGHVAFDRATHAPPVIHYDRTATGWTPRIRPDALPPAITVAAAMRSAPMRVLDVAATARNIGDGLVSNGAMTEGARFTSAEFALEMVKTMVEVSYLLEAT